MHSFTRRLLTVGTAVAISLVSFAPAPPAQAKPWPTPVVASDSRTARAATWLAAHPATDDEGYLYKIYNATGLAAASTSSTASTLRTRVRELRDGAASAIASKPTLAPYLTVLVDALHLNPKSFGSVDLITTIKTGVTKGDYSNAYGQALAIIALKRSGASVPSTLVQSLLAGQATTGAGAGSFGYSYGGTFYTDPDSTALAIQALDLVGKRKYASRVKTAVAWAKANQNAAGYWGAWSPVDTTALMATAFKTVAPSTQKNLKLGASYTKAFRWLKTQQLADGSFPASLNGTSGDRWATFDGIFLLKGKVWSTFSYRLRSFTKKARPVIIGAKTVGSALTAKLAGWRPSLAANTKVKYRWLRAGKPIASATTSTYVLTAADAGKRIRVRVTVAEVGMHTVKRTSIPTAKIR